MSGGLDSVLAAKIVMEQGIGVEGIHFLIGFAETKSVEQASKILRIPLHIIDVIDEFKEVVLNPVYDYGAHLNPCLDCKIFMVKKAKEWMDRHQFDFMVTGEVLGQRPKSQRRDTLNIVKRESGVGDYLLRPLSAKLLSETVPEKAGWIDREKLYGLSGRSRKPQIALAKAFNITQYQQPAGGCLLTDKKFCDRLTVLWNFRKKRDYTRDDIELLKLGRHLKPASHFRMIIGRNEKENEKLEKLKDELNGETLKTISHAGPVVLLDGEMQPQDVEFAAQIAARFSKGRDEKKVTFEFKAKNGSTRMISVKPFAAEKIQAEWYS